MEINWIGFWSEYSEYSEYLEYPGVQWVQGKQKQAVESFGVHLRLPNDDDDEDAGVQLIEIGQSN